MRNRSMAATMDRMLTFDRALDQMLTEGWSTQPSRAWVPALDVAERQDAYLITAELPGVDPEQVELNFEQNVLAIRGTKNAGFDTQKDGDLRVYTAERRGGAFERAVRLPEYVDADRIEASYEHGVLTIVVPKSEAAQPRRISIRSGNDQKQVEG